MACFVVAVATARAESLPDADEITPTIARDATVLERYESGLVRAANVTLPTLLGPGLAPQGHAVAGATNCDLNGDGRITYGGNARELPNADPVTRAILQGFGRRSALDNLNNINVRSLATTAGICVER